MASTQLETRLLNLVHQVRSYKNPNWAKVAREVALTPDVEDELEINATIRISANPEIDLRDAMAIELMAWFKKTFFTWFKQPENSTPLPTTRNPATGDRIESYKLADGSTLKFERFNDPLQLIKPENRKGRCGEWANCFCFLASVMGFEVRYVSALFDDHVWAEIYSHKLDRWIHFDPCENSFDKPLLYELGWGKKLSFVVAAEICLISDVSKKYSIDHDKLLANQLQIPDPGVDPDKVQQACKAINIRIKNEMNLPENRVAELRRRRRIELAQFAETGKIDKSTLKKGQFGGRKNADIAWVKARGEDGPGHQQSTSTKDQSSSSSSSNTCSASKSIKLSKNFKYFSSTDKFFIDDNNNDGVSELLAAENCFKKVNMFRKVEDDWQMAYICRDEDCNFGYFSLKFEFLNDISAVIFTKLDERLYNSGQSSIALTTSSINKIYSPKTLQNITQDNSSTNHKNFKIHFGKPIKYFILHFRSWDKNLNKNDNVQWQYCQFFRDKLQSKEANLEFRVE